MSIVVTIRTANRAPHRNHLRATVGQLLAQGVSPADIYVAATDPDVRWLTTELADMPVHLDIPAVRRTPNENGLAMIASIPEPARYGWTLLLEDDLELCRDFVGSIERWLTRYARADRHLHKFFDLAAPLRRQAAFDIRLERLRSSQAIALRMEDALDFLAWGREHLTDWPQTTAWGKRYQDHWRGFDKLCASWALNRWPWQPGLMSNPMFCRHVGTTSSIHARTAANDRYFAGVNWSFR